MNRNARSAFGNVLMVAVIGMICTSLLGGSVNSLYGQSQYQTKLHVGDGVRIMVWQDISFDKQAQLDDLGLAGDYFIDVSGSILVPVLGEVKVAGYSANTVAQIIEEKLAIKTIKVICMPLIRVTVLGEVQKPGSYLAQPNESLWEVISKTGGPSNDADMTKMRVERGGSVIIDHLLEGFEKAHSLSQLGIRSGDLIVLPKVSKVTMGDVLRYATFAMSVGVFYLQLSRN